MRNSRDQSGFTIIEILLAMAIFSFVMITIITAFTQIIRSYRKGVVSQRTQESTREIVDLISKEARNSSDVEVKTAGGGASLVRLLCFNNTVFEYRKAGKTLKQRSSEDCVSSTAGESVVSDELDVLDFVADDKSSVNGTKLGFNLTIAVGTDNGTGGAGLLDSTGKVCDPSKAGSQFCSTSSLTTSIGLRGEKADGP